MVIAYKRAQDEDVPKLIDIQKACFKAEYDLYGECPAYTVTRLELIEKLKTPGIFYYKILCDGELIGAVEVHEVHEASGKRLELVMICILEEFRDKGIGQKTVMYIEALHPGVCWMLVTPEKNERNQYFYEKIGYEKESKKYRSDCLTLIQYRKRILNA